jgi:hypothetical protein
MLKVNNARSVVMSKPRLQQTLKDCRRNGFTVDKRNSGYDVFNDDQLIMRAMIGTSTYLVRFDQNVLELFDPNS